MTAGDIGRLRWRCRRGMRELDAVLQSFVANGLRDSDAAEMACFERFLDLPDPEVFAYLTGRRVPDDPDTARLVERIRSLHRPSA